MSVLASNSVAHLKMIIHMGNCSLYVIASLFIVSFIFLMTQYSSGRTTNSEKFICTLYCALCVRVSSLANREIYTRGLWTKCAYSVGIPYTHFQCVCRWMSKIYLYFLLRFYDTLRLRRIYSIQAVLCV